MSNESERVEDLEQRVKELEATVRGLTEELVEANERIRQLEDEHDLLESTGVEGGRDAAGRQSQQAEQPQQSAETEGQEADAADESDEEPKSEDAQEQEEEEESGLGDDIIVA